MNNQNQEQKTVPELTPEQKPKPKPKLPNWASILIIVIAAVIVVGLVSWAGYELFKPAPSKLPEGGDVEDEFKDWKTYQNEEYRFEFKYPQDWETKTDVNKASPKETFVSPEDSQGKKYTVGIDIEDNPNEYPVSKWLDDYVKNHPTELNLQKSDRQFGILVGEEVIGFPWIVEILTFWSSKDKRIFNFYLMPYHQVPQNIIDTYHQILSTFKFIEPEISANWKTYQNEEYGWEIQYPGEWTTRKLIIDGEIKDNVAILSGGKISDAPTAPEKSVSITVVNNPLAMSIEEKVNQDCRKQPEGWCSYYQNPKEMLVGGVRALKYEDIPGELSYTSVYLSRNSQFIIIGTNNFVLEEIFNQILSTFKFIE